MMFMAMRWEMREAFPDQKKYKCFMTLDRMTVSQITDVRQVTRHDLCEGRGKIEEKNDVFFGIDRQITGVQTT